MKSISNVLSSIYEVDYVTVPVDKKAKIEMTEEEDIEALIKKLTTEMKQAAKNLEFEKAADLRDQIKDLNNILLQMG